jgi:hypothetical protein
MKMMKKWGIVGFTAFVLFVLSCSMGKAQGNLQFNAIKLISTQETVPVGKVWKLESAPYKIDAVGSIGNYTSASPGVEYVQSILVNGNILFVQAIRYYDGSWHTFTGPTCQFPMWLPEGSTLASGVGVQFISAIEFNVVP